MGEKKLWINFLFYYYSISFTSLYNNTVSAFKNFGLFFSPGSLPGDVSGELLVDIGSGPTLYQVMSGCEVFNKVILSDFLEVNRQELRRWLQDEGKCSLDWTPYLEHVCKLEGRR